MSVATGLYGIYYAWNLKCDPSLGDVDCTRFLIYNPPSSIITLVLAVIPIVLGVTLGVATIAGEIERGTASFAWSIGVDRRRWLAEQVVYSLLAVAAIGLVCGVLNTLIVARLNPGHYLPESFAGYGLWGPILVVRGFCAYAIALFVGTLLRRQAASVALSLVVVTIAVISALVIGQSFETAHIIPNDDPRVDDALFVYSGVLMPDGSFQTIFECGMKAPSSLDSHDNNMWVLANCPPVGTYVAGTQMPVVELRESSVLGFLAVAGFGGVFQLVVRRRPQI